MRQERPPCVAMFELKPWLEPLAQGANWNVRKFGNWVWYSVRSWDPGNHTLAEIDTEFGVAPALLVVEREPNWACILAKYWSCVVVWLLVFTDEAGE